MGKRIETIFPIIADKLALKKEQENVLEKFFMSVDKYSHKEEVVKHLSSVIEQPIDNFSKKKVEILKQVFYKLKKNETEVFIKAPAVKSGKEVENYRKEKDTTEERLKELLASFRKKKSILIAEVDKIKEQNFFDKKNIIEKIKVLITNQNKQGNFHKIFDEFKELQQRWEGLTQIPQNTANDLWKDYRYYCKQFYDLVRINDIMRDYDFKKNLNLKQELCEKIENIDYSTLVSVKEWNEQSRRVLEIRNEWKAIGFVSKIHVGPLFDRFNMACEAFFYAKNTFYKSIKSILNANLKKKEALCIEAEMLKDSQEWEKTTNKLIALQKEWRSVGSTTRKHSEAIWKRFISACNHFFERKNDYFSFRRKEEAENLKNKKAIMLSIQTINLSLPIKEVIAQLRKYIIQFNDIGFVPFDEKENICKEYQAVIDSFIKHLKIDKSEKEIQLFRFDLDAILSLSTRSSKNKFLDKRNKLIRDHAKIKNDIQIYENNIGFLSGSSKKVNNLIQEVQSKIDALKSSLVFFEKMKFN